MGTKAVAMLGATLLVGCFEDSPVDSTETIVVSTRTERDTTDIRDTILIDSSGIVDSTVSDTSVSVEETWQFTVTTVAVTDTTFRMVSVIETTIREMAISVREITDSLYESADSLVSDTVVGADTLLDTAVNVLGETAIFDTLFSDTTVLDTQSVSKYIVATTAVWGEGGNVGIMAAGGSAGSGKLLAIHGDNSVASYNGAIYILERLGKDIITRIDGPDISAENVVYQTRFAVGANISGISFVSESKAYVTQYGASDLVVFDPESGTCVRSIFFDLYTHAGETVPNMQAAVVAGDRLFVLCQRLKTFQGDMGPYMDVGDESGLVVVVSTVSDAVVDTIQLERKNPAAMGVIDGFVYVSCTGSWSDATDGGVERINLSDYSDHELLVSESDFGSNISDMIVLSPTQAYVCVSRNNADWSKFWTELVEFNPERGTVGTKVEAVADAFGGLAFDGTYLYAGDRSADAPGVVVIDPADNSKVAGPVDIEMPVNDLAVLSVPTEE